MDRANAPKSLRKRYAQGFVKCASCHIGLTHTDHQAPGGVFKTCANVNCMNEEEQENAFMKVFCAVCVCELGTYTKGMYKFIQGRIEIEPDDDFLPIKQQADPFSRETAELKELFTIFDLLDQDTTGDAITQEMMQRIDQLGTSEQNVQYCIDKLLQAGKLQNLNN